MGGGGSGGSGWGDQDGCERRIEVIVKMPKTKIGKGAGGGGVRSGRGWGVEEWGGGWSRGRVEWGRVGCERRTVFGKIQKKIGGGGGGSCRGGGGGGSGWM